MATSARRMVREKVLQTLYAHELSNEPITTVVENTLGQLTKSRSEFAFAKDLCYAVVQHKDELDSYIRQKVTNWQFNRIAVIDRLILRMGICELLYFPDIPPKVTINEAIEVAKSFSTERSGQFVNGILDAIFEVLRTTGRLTKMGRGLINETPPSAHTKKKHG